MVYEHVGITVSNLDNSINFYTKIFNLRVLKRTPLNAYLYKGTDMIELIQSKKKRETKKRSSSKGLIEVMTEKAGVVHVGFRVDNMDEAIASFEKFRKEVGGELIVPPVMYEQKLKTVADVSEDKLKRVLSPTKWRIAVLSDPDGVLIELQER